MVSNPKLYPEVEDDLAIKSWLSGMVRIRQHRIPRTGRLYLIYLREFYGGYVKSTPTAWLEAVRKDPIKAAADVNSFLEHLASTSVADGTIHVARNALIKFLRENRIPTDDIRSVAIEPKRKYVPFSEQEARDFIAALRHPRDKALFLLAFKSGLRLEELRLLSYDDVSEVFDANCSEPYAIYSRDENSKGEGDMSASATRRLPIHSGHGPDRLRSSRGTTCLTSPDRLSGGTSTRRAAVLDWGLIDVSTGLGATCGPASPERVARATSSRRS